MAVASRAGRVNYEPNSHDGKAGGPRESAAGYRSTAATEGGTKLQARSATFADHYSQARQFYVSQTPVERQHIASAFTFELSKVDDAAIRERMLAHLLNVDEGLARTVGAGLGVVELPAPRHPCEGTVA